LVFGICVHRALEQIYSHNTASDPELLALASTGFLTEWQDYDLDQESHHPRSVSHGLEILERYISQFGTEIRATKVHAVEQPFKVPLEESDAVTYHGRLDTVVELPQVPGLYVLEHKTAASFSPAWQNGFSPNMQLDGYCHALNMLFPNENTRGVLVNGLLVQKTKMDFVRIPVMRQYEHLDAWRWEILDKIQDINFNWQRLLDFRTKPGFVEQPFMPTFPKNTCSCQYYGGCQYLDLCKSSSNPEHWTEVPDGFVYRPWDYTRS